MNTIHEWEILSNSFNSCVRKLYENLFILKKTIRQVLLPSCYSTVWMNYAEDAYLVDISQLVFVGVWKSRSPPGSNVHQTEGDEGRV